MEEIEVKVYIIRSKDEHDKYFVVKIVRIVHDFCHARNRA